MGMKLRRTAAASAASVLGLTLLAACGGEATPSPAPPAALAVETGGMALPDAAGAAASPMPAAAEAPPAPAATERSPLAAGAEIVSSDAAVLYAEPDPAAARFAQTAASA